MSSMIIKYLYSDTDAETENEVVAMKSGEYPFTSTPDEPAVEDGPADHR
jgi:hypothetical protein